MASRSNHEIVEIWQHREYQDVRWHVDKNGTIVRTTGPKDGNGKILMVRHNNETGEDLIYAGMIRVVTGTHTTRRAKITDKIVQDRLKAFDRVSSNR